jgi:hypothetical protein
MTKIPREVEPPKPMTSAEREARKAFRQVAAEKAMTEHEIAQKAFSNNRERLKAERLAREAADRKKKNPARRNLFRSGTKPGSHQLKLIGLSARRCQCSPPKTLSNALACLKNVPNGRATQFPDNITEKWPLTIDRCPSSIRK